MITDRERETALALLARSRVALLNAVEGVTEDQARWKPAPERWSGFSNTSSIWRCRTMRWWRW